MPEHRTPDRPTTTTAAPQARAEAKRASAEAKRASAETKPGIGGSQAGIGGGSAGKGGSSSQGDGSVPGPGAGGVPTDGGTDSCDCRVVGASDETSETWVATLALFALLALRPRKRRAPR